ncbi:uncharacterized protein [Clytia hemisphaerica]|uniref:uncharacterized protein n=1 Tax=Clytia hemisphaerica TaxID=252671 RepID=UPI0034D40B95
MSKAEMISDCHMGLCGNPGTGKTMVARCMAGILKYIGLLKSSELIEVQRSDLVGAYIGTTEEKPYQSSRKQWGRCCFWMRHTPCLRIPTEIMEDYAVEEIMRYLLPSPDDNMSNILSLFLLDIHPT